MDRLCTLLLTPLQKPRYGISPERALVNWVYCVGEPPAGYQIFSHRPWLEHHHTPLGSRHRMYRQSTNAHVISIVMLIEGLQLQRAGL
jgi:hypothetical protein